MGCQHSQMLYDEPLTVLSCHLATNETNKTNMRSKKMVSNTSTDKTETIFFNTKELLIKEMC